MEKYQVLLYYNFVAIDDHEQFAADHLQFCKDLDLKGRILVAHNGVNGTVSGTIEQTAAYMKAMQEDGRFHDTVFKIDDHDGHAFSKMHVRPREELVTLRLEDPIDPQDLTGAYLDPKEFYEAMQEEDTVILDTRNDTNMTLAIFAVPFAPTFVLSKNYLNG